MSLRHCRAVLNRIAERALSSSCPWRSQFLVPCTAKCTVLPPAVPLEVVVPGLLCARACRNAGVSSGGMDRRVDVKACVYRGTLCRVIASVVVTATPGAMHARCMSAHVCVRCVCAVMVNTPCCAAQRLYCSGCFLSFSDPQRLCSTSCWFLHGRHWLRAVSVQSNTPRDCGACIVAYVQGTLASVA